MDIDNNHIIAVIIILVLHGYSAIFVAINVPYHLL